MAKNISILGSTGSIGTQTLEVARNLNLKVVGLSTNSNVELLLKQVEEFNPEAVSVGNKELADKLEKQLKGKIKVLYGDEGLIGISTLDSADTIVVSVVGITGLAPTLAAIRKGKDIALANKETLVAGGSLVMDEAEKNNIKIYPVDSEHSAIFQCLQGNKMEQVEKIILTASGGPFRGKKKKELEKATVDQALSHPSWNMGKKVTIDAATLMNKGFEVIEAKWLFGLEPEQIEVIIHPQSIIHSMVEYKDGSVIAQLGAPDMRIPIQYALNYPQRTSNSFKKLDLSERNTLTFENVDYETFPCLALAFETMNAGGTAPVVLNAANEVAVELFLDEKITLNDIPEIIKYSLTNHRMIQCPTYNDIINTDIVARERAKEWFEKKQITGG